MDWTHNKIKYFVLLCLQNFTVPKKCKEVVYTWLQLKNTVQGLSEARCYGSCPSNPGAEEIGVLGTTNDRYSVKFLGGGAMVCNEAVSLFTKPPFPGLTSSSQNPSPGDFAAWGGGGRGTAGQAHAGPRSVRHGNYTDSTTKALSTNTGIAWHCLPATALFSGAASRPEILAFRISPLATAAALA